MEENTKDIGKMENNTEKENFTSQIRRFGKKEFGVMGDASHGKTQNLLS